MDLAKTGGAALQGALTGAPLGPVGMAAGALLGALPDLLGAFGVHLGGADGEAVGQAVIDAAVTATGAAQPSALDVLALPAEQRVALQVQLAQIALQAAVQRDAADKAERDATLAALEAQLADVQSARAQTVSLAQIHSPMAYGAPLVSVVVLTIVAWIGHLVLTQSIPADSLQVALIMIGGLIGMATSVVSYWVGSSAGAASKDHSLANSVPAALLLAREAPHGK